MPLSIFKKHGIGDARPTTITLQLDDMSICYPQKKIDDVLIWVTKFVFLVDFIIMDFSVDGDTHILFVCSLFVTGRTLMDVGKKGAYHES